MVAEPTDKSVYTFVLGQRDFKDYAPISFRRFLSAVSSDCVFVFLSMFFSNVALLISSQSPMTVRRLFGFQGTREKLPLTDLER